MSTQEKFITAAEASVGLAEQGITVSPRSLLDRSGAHKVPSFKINGRRCFKLSELLSHFIGQGRDEGAAGAL